MKNNAFLKIFAAVMFVAFAAVSCWSTTESLFLTMENAQIPKWVFWIAVVGLFVLTSICTKLVVDSLNPNIVMDGRKPKLILGILGVVLLWLLFSMPTNAHTFFYKQMAKNTAIKDLTTLKGNLDGRNDRFSMEQGFDEDWKDFEKKVNGALTNLKKEIKSAKEPGFGPKAMDYLRKIELDLFKIPVEEIRIERTHSTSRDEIDRVCDYYDTYIKEQLREEKARRDLENQPKLDNFDENHAEAITVLAAIDKNLSDLQKDDLNREEVLKQSRALLMRGTAVLKNLSSGLSGDEKSIPSQRLTSVIKVWGDYLRGEYRGTDFTLWYWILLAVIVDVAAFAFFVIAFKKEN